MVTPSSLAVSSRSPLPSFPELPPSSGSPQGPRGGRGREARAGEEGGALGNESRVHTAKPKSPDLKGMPFPCWSTILSVMVVCFRVSQWFFQAFWSEDPFIFLKVIRPRAELFLSVYCIRIKIEKF